MKPTLYSLSAQALKDLIAARLVIPEVAYVYNGILYLEEPLEVRNCRIYAMACDGDKIVLMDANQSWNALETTDVSYTHVISRVYQKLYSLTVKKQAA